MIITPLNSVPDGLGITVATIRNTSGSILQDILEFSLYIGNDPGKVILSTIDSVLFAKTVQNVVELVERSCFELKRLPTDLIDFNPIFQIFVHMLHAELEHIFQIQLGSTKATELMPDIFVLFEAVERIDTRF